MANTSTGTEPTPADATPTFQTSILGVGLICRRLQAFLQTTDLGSLRLVSKAVCTSVDANASALSLNPCALSRAILSDRMQRKRGKQATATSTAQQHGSSTAFAISRWPVLSSVQVNTVRGGPLSPWLVHALVQEVVLHDTHAGNSSNGSSSTAMPNLMRLLHSLTWPHPSPADADAQASKDASTHVACGAALGYVGDVTALYGESAHAVVNPSSLPHAPLSQICGPPVSADWAVLSALCERVMCSEMHMLAALPQMRDRLDAVMHAPPPPGVTFYYRKEDYTVTMSVGTRIKFPEPSLPVWTANIPAAQGMHQLQIEHMHMEEQASKQSISNRMAAQKQAWTVQACMCELRGLGLWLAYESVRVAQAMTHGSAGPNTTDTKEAPAQDSEKAYERSYKHVMVFRSRALKVAVMLRSWSQPAGYTAAAWEIASTVALLALRAGREGSLNAKRFSLMEAVDALNSVGIKGNVTAWPAVIKDAIMAVRASSPAPVGKEGLAAYSCAGKSFCCFDLGHSHCPAVLEAISEAASVPEVAKSSKAKAALEQLGVRVSKIPALVGKQVAGSNQPPQPVAEPVTEYNTLTRFHRETPRFKVAQFTGSTPADFRLQAGRAFVRLVWALADGRVGSALRAAYQVVDTVYRGTVQPVAGTRERVVEELGEAQKASHLQAWEHVLACQGWLVHVANEGVGIWATTHGLANAGLLPNPAVLEEAGNDKEVSVELALTRGPLPAWSGSDAGTQSATPPSAAAAAAGACNVSVKGKGGKLTHGSAADRMTRWLSLHADTLTPLQLRHAVADYAWGLNAITCINTPMGRYTRIFPDTNMTGLPLLMAASQGDAGSLDDAALYSYGGLEGVSAVCTQLLGLPRVHWPYMEQLEKTSTALFTEPMEFEATVAFKLLDLARTGRAYPLHQQVGKCLVPSGSCSRRITQPPLEPLLFSAVQRMVIGSMRTELDRNASLPRPEPDLPMQPHQSPEVKYARQLVTVGMSILACAAANLPDGLDADALRPLLEAVKEPLKPELALHAAGIKYMYSKLASQALDLQPYAIAAVALMLAGRPQQALAMAQRDTDASWRGKVVGMGMACAAARMFTATRAAATAEGKAMPPAVPYEGDSTIANSAVHPGSNSTTTTTTTTTTIASRRPKPFIPPWAHAVTNVMRSMHDVLLGEKGISSMGNWVDSDKKMAITTTMDTSDPRVPVYMHCVQQSWVWQCGYATLLEALNLTFVETLALCRLLDIFPYYHAAESACFDADILDEDEVYGDEYYDEYDATNSDYEEYEYNGLPIL